MSQIRILHLISSNAILGAECVLLEIVRNTCSSKFSPHIGIITAGDGLSEQFRKRLDSADTPVEWFRCTGRISLSLLRSIQSYVMKNQICIIHSHNYKSNFYSFLLKTIFNSRVFHVATNHNWIISSRSERLYKRIDCNILKFFDAVVAVSPSIASEMASLGIPREKTRLILNGIDTELLQKMMKRNQARDALSLSRTAFVIGCVASLSPEKAHLDLIRAFSMINASIPEAHLVIIGGGNQKAIIEEEANFLGIGKSVALRGHLPDARLYLRAFDVFSLVSHSEGLPMALLEAMVAGIPVVATSVGAIPLVIEDGWNGILVEPGNLESIALALRTLWIDPELRIALSKQATLAARQSFSSVRMARDYIEFYSGLISN